MKDSQIEGLLHHCLLTPRARALVLMGLRDGKEAATALANRILVLFPVVARYHTDNFADLRFSIESQNHRTLVNIGITSMKPTVDAQIEIRHHPKPEHLRGMEPSCVYIDQFCDKGLSQAAYTALRLPSGERVPHYFSSE